MNSTNRFRFYAVWLMIMSCCSCKSLNLIDQLPGDTYRIKSSEYQKLDKTINPEVGTKNFLADVEQSDSIFTITPIEGSLKTVRIDLNNIQRLKMYRYTLDIDILTVPFKIRPSTGGFPEQLNANFDAALYFGRRLDSYTIERHQKGHSVKSRITGVGYGYGGFVGIGSVTMNPFVTNQKIDYEYDGFVLNGGVAGIYDAKIFNLGIAVGADFLVDKNRRNWIYQGKPWIGVLFGINLN
jgi:hypothetical protein